MTTEESCGGMIIHGLARYAETYRKRNETRRGEDFLVTYIDEKNREFSESFFLGFPECETAELDYQLLRAGERIRAQLKTAEVQQ